MQCVWNFIILSAIAILFATGCASSPNKKISAVTPLPSELKTENQPNPPQPSPINQIKSEGTDDRKEKIPAISTNNIPRTVQSGWSIIDSLTNNSFSIRYTKSPAARQCIIENGSSAVTIIEGKQFIYFDGIKVDLGYPPKWENGRCYLNELDVLSIILPLLKPVKGMNIKSAVVVIDPGHGGSDPGSISVLNRKPEKEYTLDIAKRVQSVLTACGMTAILTRTNDARIERTSRVAFAEKVGASLFVSIHLNYYEKSQSISGIETYCITPIGLPSTFNRGFNDDTSIMHPNNNFDSKNIVLAAQIQSALVKKTNSSDRGVKRARFLEVLQNQKCPAVLIEAGFLSSAREAELIDSPRYRQLLAEAIASGIIKFCNNISYKQD